MARSVTAVTSAATPARSASMSTTSPWTRVESTSITTRRRPCRSRPTLCTATSTCWRGGLRGQHLAEPADLGARDVELDRRDRVARHPHDPVDVGAGVGDPSGDRGDGVRPQRPPEQGDVGSALAASAVVALADRRPRRPCRVRRRSSRRRRSACGRRVAPSPGCRARGVAASTICSMSSTSTPASDSVLNIAAVTPGRSRPISVMRTVWLVVPRCPLCPRAEPSARRATSTRRRSRRETPAGAEAARSRLCSASHADTAPPGGRRRRARRCAGTGAR